MAVYQIIFNIVLYFSEGLILYYYANSFFQRKYSAQKTITFIMLFHIVLFGIYYANSTILNFAALLIIYCLIFLLLYDCGFFAALFNTIALLCIMLASEWVVIFLTSLFLKKDFYVYKESLSLQVLDTTLSKLAYYFICLVLAHIFSKKKVLSQNKSGFWELMIMPAASVFALFVFRYISLETMLSGNANILCGVASLCLLISNIVVFIIYENSINNAAELYELKTAKQNQKIEQQYLDILEQNNKDLKIFTHDIKNHLEQISNLTDDPGIKEYVSKLYKTVNQYSNIAVSGNKALDVIISKYNTLCENKNISISFNTKTANLADIDNTDLSTIMNNALDNAIQSAEKSKNKLISVDIYSKELFEIIKIQNSCDTAPLSADKKLFTSKSEKEFHGFGTESIKRAVKKYNGIFDWSYNDEYKIFETTVAIPKQIKK